METNDNEYNNNRSIYQPTLFDNFTEEELDAELIEAGEPAEMYEFDFEELDMDNAELFLM